ncbi:MAG: amylo-alpha-1,6-glucosidase [Spirochaetota bacterium]
MSPQPEQLFTNLIAYTREEFPFVDRYSQFGLTFEEGRPLGPGALQVRSVVVNQPAADAHLTAWFEHDGRPFPVRRRALTSLPWEALEQGTAAAADGTLVSVEARHVFLDEVRALSSFTFLASQSAASVRVRILGQFSGEQKVVPGLLAQYGAGDAQPRVTFSATEGRSITGGLMSQGEPFLPSPAIRITPVSGFPATPAVSLTPHWMDVETVEPAADEVRAVGASLFYSFDAGTLSLKPGEPATITFLTELSVATSLDREHHWDGLPDRLAAASDGEAAVDAAAAASRHAFLERVRWDDPPAVPAAGLAQAWRARWALTRTGYQANERGGEFGRLVASTCVPSSHGFTKAFFWDALFSSAAASRFDPRLARGAILAQFVRQDEHGYCPEHGFNYHVPGRSVIGAPQAPVAAWAVDKYLAVNPDDTGFLEEVYPILVRNHRYWQELSDQDRDGLSEWTWSGQTADNSPLWDEVVRRSVYAGCSWIPPIASVQLNSFLYRDANHLADFARRLGRDEEASAYRARAQALQDALLRVCYLPEEKRFWDYNHATGRHTRIPTFYMCWPIWAGMDVPENARRDLIENVLLDPEQFFGPIPFPSVAYNHPSYEPAGYWRGKAWPQITYWLLEMLVAEGYTDAAKEAARRFLAAYDRNDSFPENLSTDPSDLNGAGVQDYNWGVAAYYLIATGAYLEE